MAEGPKAKTISWIDRLTGAWMLAAHKKPWTVLLTIGVLIVLSGLATTRLGVDADSSKMLSPNLPDQRRAHALNAAFPNLKATILVVISSDQADAADLATQYLADRLAQSATISEVFAPAVDQYLAAHGFLYQETSEVTDSFQRLSKSANMLARLRSERSLDGFVTALDEAILLADRADIGPEALERLFAETAATIEAQNARRPYMFAWSTVLDEAKTGPTTRVISVLPLLDRTRLNPAKPALQTINTAVTDLPEELAKTVTVGVTGEPALRAEEIQSVLGTIGISLAASLLLVALILRVGLGSAGLAALALLSLVAALVLTTGAAALIVGKLNLVSVAFIVLMVGLGIDFAIHILAHIDEMLGHSTPTAEAIELTGNRAGLALGLSAVTTTLAFLAFTTTDFAGMAQLGLIGAMGVPIAYFVAASMIPAMLALLPSLGRSAGSSRMTLPRVPKGVPIVVLVLGTLALFPASQARFDADPMALRNPDAPSVQTFRRLAENPETSPYRVSILASSAAEADRLATAAEAQIRIGSALNFGDLVPEEQDRKLDILDLAAPSIDHATAGQPTALLSETGAAPEDRLVALTNRLALMEGMSQRLYRALQAYLPNRTETSDQVLEDRLFQAMPLMFDRMEAMLEADTINRESLPKPLAERYLSRDGIYRVEIVPEGDLSDPNAASAFAEAVKEIAPEAAGGPVQLTAAARSVSRAMLQATLLAALATGALAFFATRRIRDTLAILIPLSIAGILTAAASALFDLPFNYANVIVLPLMIGIGVDSGIHIALRERRAPGAVFATSTPRAVVVSAATTVAAFGTLMLSDHRGTASMGSLLAIAMLATVAAVLTLTPALIRWRQRVPR